MTKYVHIPIEFRTTAPRAITAVVDPTIAGAAITSCSTTQTAALIADALIAAAQARIERERERIALRARYNHD